MSTAESSSSASGSKSGPSTYKMYAAESDLEQDLPSEADSDISEEHELKAVKSAMSLRTLSKAQRVLHASKKRHAPPEIPEQTKIQAREALLKLKRTGRKEPRLPLLTSHEKTLRNVNGEMKAVEHRANKHAPMEMSSKRAVSRVRNAVEVPNIQARDPRFDPALGEFSKEAFEHSYNFLHDQRREELANLKQQVKQSRKNASMSKYDREQLELKMSKMQSQMAEEDKARRERDALKKWNKGEKEKQSTEGKKPYFLKKGQKKELLKESKMEELSHNKRRLRKHQQRQASKETKRDMRYKPPERLQTVQ